MLLLVSCLFTSRKYSSFYASTCPAILAIIVQVIQVFQIIRVDDGRTGRPVSGTPNRPGRGTRWDSGEAVLSPHVSTTNRTSHSSKSAQTLRFESDLNDYSNKMTGAIITMIFHKLQCETFILEVFV